jgi:nitronate monooxygenase
MEFPELRIGNLTSRIPIIQGGMGIGISLSGLASAVANEGGIGVIASAMIGINEPDVLSDPVAANTRALKKTIQRARALTPGILGVNIMYAMAHYPHSVKAAIEEGIDIIFSGAGLPMDLPGYLKDGARTKLVPIVSSAIAAKLICQRWLSKYNYLPDAFVVEGPESGGHLGFKTDQIDDPAFAIENLLVEVIDTIEPIATERGVTVPVIAAGGIYTGADIQKFLKLGAAGVQMGTRFVATHECDASLDFKKMYLNAKKDDSIIIKSPIGMPGRAIRNKFLEGMNNKAPFECLYNCIKKCKRTKGAYCLAAAMDSARKGNFNSGFAFASCNAYRIDKIVSVGELIESLKVEFDQAFIC